MANEMMQGLLQSLLQTPEQQQQAEGARNVELMSQPNPLAATLAYMMPQRTAGMERGIRGLFGLQQPPTAAELIAKNPQQISTSAGLIQLAQALRTVDPAQAARAAMAAQAMQQQEAEQTRALKVADLERRQTEANIARLESEVQTPEDKEALNAMRQAQAAEANARIANMPIEAQARDRQLDLEALRIEAMNQQTKLGLQDFDVRTRDRINNAAAEALSSFNDAANLIRVADAWQANPPVPGFLGSVEKGARDFLGRQGGEDVLRAQYNQVMMSGVLASLPPGPATDKDIEIAKEGWLDSFANPERVASFMRGMAKLAAISAEQSNAKADFIQKNGTQAGFLDAWQERVKDPEFINSVSKKYGLQFDEKIPVSDDAAAALLTPNAGSPATQLPPTTGFRGMD